MKIHKLSKLKNNQKERGIRCLVKNIQMNERKNRSKVTRYAIKKLSMGTASVAVALGFMFVQGQTIAHADTVEATATETTAKLQKRRKILSKTTKLYTKFQLKKQKQQLQLKE